LSKVETICWHSKATRGTLSQDVQDGFLTTPGLDRSDSVEAAHGRIEKRVAIVNTDPTGLCYLNEAHHWPHLAALGKIEETRTLPGEESTSERFYLLSKEVAAKELNPMVGSRWEVENKLHWAMDMVFNEDRNHTRNAAENLSHCVISHSTSSG
jgi:hypothetical protein